MNQLDKPFLWERRSGDSLWIWSRFNQPIKNMNVWCDKEVGRSRAKRESKLWKPKASLQLQLSAIFMVFTLVGLAAVQAQAPLVGGGSALEDIERSVKDVLIKNGILPEPGFEKNLLLSLTAADTGQVLTNATIGSHGVQGDRWPDTKIVAATPGVWLVRYPEKATGLVVDVETGGYAATRLSWDVGRNRPMPKSYLLRLDRAARIGGTVVDAKGNPVAGATVHFGHEDLHGVDAVETHDFFFIDRESDSKGRWQIDCLGEDMIGLLFCNAQHPEHVDSDFVRVSGDPAAGKSLLAGNFAFHLGHSFDLTGVVIDMNGAPIPNATVTARLMAGLDRTSTSGTNGNFVIHHAGPGAYDITVRAPEFAGAVVHTNVTESTGPVRITIGRGDFIRIRVVDKDGKPVAGALFDPNMMRNQFSMLGPQNLGVPRPTRCLFSDDEGRIAWQIEAKTNWYFDVSAENFMARRGLQALPGGPESTVVLSPALVISGAVTDAANGTFIPNFEVIGGYAEIDNTTRSTNFVWDRSEHSHSEFAKGYYRKSLEHLSLWNQRCIGYMVKFSADGYAPILSRVFAENEGPVRLNVALQGVPAKEIAIQLPNGEPAGPIWLSRVEKGGRLRLENRELIADDLSVRMRADKKGRFNLPPDDSIIAVAVAVPEGFGIAKPADLAAGTPWRLQSWGRVECTWFSGKNYVAGRELVLDHLKGWECLTLDANDYHGRTDSNGFFVLPGVPPGVIEYSRQVPTSISAKTRDRKSEIAVLSGETTHLVIGRMGFQIVGKLIVPEGIKQESLDTRLVGETRHPPALENARGNPEAIRQFYAAPEGAEFLRIRKQFYLYKDDAGNLAAEDVEPGEYSITATAYLVDMPIGKRPEFFLRSPTINFMIPTNQTYATIEFGELKMEKVPYPTPNLPTAGGITK